MRKPVPAQANQKFNALEIKHRTSTPASRQSLPAFAPLPSFLLRQRERLELLRRALLLSDDDAREIIWEVGTTQICAKDRQQ